jgi:hypothetical protein
LRLLVAIELALTFRFRLDVSTIKESGDRMSDQGVEQLFAELFPDEEEIVRAFDDARRDIRYIVTDYPVELLTSKFKEENEEEGDLYIPPYQRQLRWIPKSKSYFIESVLLRIPVPPIFLYEVKGKLEIVDGSQRVRTLHQFVDNQFPLTELEKLDILNGMRFKDLPPLVQKRFLNTSIRSFVLDEATEHSTRVEMFRRLNTTGKKLHDAEIRKGAYQGPFLSLILDCSDSELFRELTPRISKASDANSERQELVTRFFVYSDNYLGFRHDVQRFLDNHLISGNETLKAADLNRMSKEFFDTMLFIKQHCPHAFYRTEKAGVLPRVRFEAVAVGTCLALRELPDLDVENFDWLRGEDLNLLVRTDASNSGPRLRTRIEFVRDMLLSLSV